MNKEDGDSRVRELEQLLFHARKKMYASFPLVGELTEGHRLYNIMVMLKFCYDDIPVEVFNHMLYEEALSEELADEWEDQINVAVLLEKAMFGVYQNSLGSEWGLKMIQEALSDLSGQEVISYAWAIASSLEKYLKRNAGIGDEDSYSSEAAAE